MEKFKEELVMVHIYYAKKTLRGIKEGLNKAKDIIEGIIKSRLARS